MEAIKKKLKVLQETLEEAEKRATKCEAELEKAEQKSQEVMAHTGSVFFFAVNRQVNIS